MKTYITILSGILLTGCTVETLGLTELDSDNVSTIQLDGVTETIHSFTLDSGVDCVVYEGYRAGGITCNWDKLNK